MCDKMAISAYIWKIFEKKTFLRLQIRGKEMFNHKRADLWLPDFGFKRPLLSLLKQLL